MNKGSKSEGKKWGPVGLQGEVGGSLQSAMVGGRERKKGRRAQLSGVDWPVWKHMKCRRSAGALSAPGESVALRRVTPQPKPH